MGFLGFGFLDFVDEGGRDAFEIFDEFVDIVDVIVVDDTDGSSSCVGANCVGALVSTFASSIVSLSILTGSPSSYSLITEEWLSLTMCNTSF